MHELEIEFKSRTQQPLLEAGAKVGEQGQAEAQADVEGDEAGGAQRKNLRAPARDPRAQNCQRARSV